MKNITRDLTATYKVNSATGDAKHQTSLVSELTGGCSRYVLRWGWDRRAVDGAIEWRCSGWQHCLLVVHSLELRELL